MPDASRTESEFERFRGTLGALGQARVPFGQLQLGEEEGDYRRRLAEAWREFVQSEVGRLTADDEFTRAVCTATAFGNEEAGVTAKHWLNQFLRDRYSERGLVFRAPLIASTPP